MKVAPSILSADFANLKSSIERVTDADMLHIDVMDGCFVSNITIGPIVIKAIKKYFTMPFDVHLMISNPNDYIEDFIDAGSDYITIHYEACEDPSSVIDRIKKNGIKCGISIKPETAVELIYPLLPKLDLVLIMSVNPGFGGQKFMPIALEKIAKLAKLKNQYHYEISVDGGINDQTFLLVKEAGADIVVAGNYIFGHQNPKEAIKKLRNK